MAGRRENENQGIITRIIHLREETPFMENPNSDEKVLAALAHGSVVFSFFGPIAPLAIWIMQRNKSKYVRYHALQALGYQALAFWGWILGLILVFIAMFGVMFVAALVSSPEQLDSPVFQVILQAVMLLSIFGQWGLFLLIGLVGAVFCMLGRNFHYPILGSWLKGKLFDGQVTDEEFERREDAWVGGVCHLTAILQLFGIITPLMVWFSQKERSAKLAFQSLQAVFYQLISVAATIFSYVGSTVFFLVLMAAMIILAGGRNGNDELLFGIASRLTILLIGGMLLLELIALFVIPLYYLMAAIAGVRTMRGHEFKYPILGGIIARRMTAPQQEFPSNEPIQ